MSRIVWLASYPKSGNTWARAFLNNLLGDGEKPASINQLSGGPIASDRSSFDEAVGVDSGDLSFDEVDRLRPEVYLHLARRAEETLYCKVHDAFTLLPDGRPLFPAEATKCVLYFVRNPLDVCVSFAHHGGHEKYDRVVRTMSERHATFVGTTRSQDLQLRQRLLSWSGHVRSWADAPGMRVHVTRYEDMKLRPEETFAALARFAELPDDPARIRKAVEFSRFDELRRQEEEEEGGFRERLPRAKSFFRKGEIGGWREVLSQEQAEELIARHTEVMRRFGYLTDDGRPVF